MSSLYQKSYKIDDLIKKSILIEEGNPARYRLQTSADNLIKSEQYRKMTFGERDKNKLHSKTILMVGETGTGKTTLINVMINYMLGVKRENKVWFEITDDQSDRTSVYSQTSRVTVYGFYPQESQINLTIIDTPGYGDTRGTDHDKEITMSLLSLSESTEVIHEIQAVCLVIDASQTRLSDRQMYIFDAVQSLFGRDIAENFVLLFTHSAGTHPKNALTAVKEAKIKCAVNDKKQPVFFLFNNCQSDPSDEEYEMIQEQSWDRSFKGMLGFFKFLDTIKPKPLRMFQEVSCQHELKANISSLQDCVQMMELKQEELKQTQEALKQDEKYVRDHNNFEYEVEVSYKEKVDIDPTVAKIMICTDCEQNCPLPDRMRNNQKDDHCKVCPNKCLYSKHVKEAKIYVTITKKQKRTNEDLKKEYDGKIGNSVALVKKLEKELQELEKQKIKFAFNAFHYVKTLQMITQNIDSLPDIDFVIEKLKELNEPKKAETLENTKAAGRE
uniref:AIG1-type G domain-containing protein n=1 Tax=Cyprinus carpio TaxID=7962 RepID=A0A8C2PXM9_CYPCA